MSGAAPVWVISTLLIDHRPQSASPCIQAQTGADIVYDLTLNDTDAKNGSKKGITYQRFVTSDACVGAGSQHKAE